MFTKTIALTIGLTGAISLAQVTTTTTLPNYPAATIGCTNTVLTSIPDHSNAIAALSLSCDHGTEIPPAGSDGVAGRISYNEGTAFAYACSSGTTNPCSEYEVFDFTEAIGTVCGSNTGYAYILDWEKTYGYGNIGDGFC